MKRTKLTIAALACMLALSVTSCNKQEATTTKSTTTAAHHSTAMTTDDAGALHNGGLDYYLANADMSDPRAGIVPLTIKYVTDQGGDETTVTETLANPTVSSVMNSDDGLSTLGAYFTEHHMSTESDFLASINRVISSAATPDDVAKGLDAIGTSVSASTDLTDDGKTALLGAISIGKASSSYWYTQQALGSSSPWVEGLSGGKPEASLFFNWKKFFGQDIAGAWVGGLFGGPWGLLGGGVGASVAEAVSQLS